MKSSPAKPMLPPPPSLTEVYAAHELKRRHHRQHLWLKTPYAIAMCALSVNILAFSMLFKVVPILLLFILWFSPLLLRGQRVLAPSRDMLICMAMPLLCWASTLWSDYPGQTLYLGTAFVGFGLCILISARVIPFHAYVRGLVIGTFIALVVTLTNGTYGADAFDSSYALVGLFGSKNQVGLVAEIGTLASIVTFFIAMPFHRKLIYSVAPFFLCVVCLYMSRSGTALVTLVGTLAVLALASFVSRLPPKIRTAIALVLVLGLVLVVVLGAMLGWEGLILQLLGKDATLTGRTYLWSEGLKVGLMRPFLGHGYHAFWVQGQPLAERYWAEFYIAARTGFHFHSTYIQTLVDLGFTGALLMVWLILANCVKSAFTVLRYGMEPEPAFLLGLSFMFLLRSFAEIDFFMGPFSVGAFLFYAIIPRLALYKKRKLALAGVTDPV